MKEKLVELAQKNAKMVLAQDREKIKREEGRTIGALKEIEQLFRYEGIKPRGGVRYLEYERL